MKTVYQVPFLDLKAQQHQIYNEIEDKFADITANTGFILGKYVDAFENGFAELHESKYCIGVSSGTDALHIALWAAGVKPLDRVIVPVNTFIATAEAVSLVGAEPLFVDCDEYFNMDVGKLAEILQRSEDRTEDRERKAERPKKRRADFSYHSGTSIWPARQHG